jgi:antitoxin ParD1/3/4
MQIFVKACYRWYDDLTHKREVPMNVSLTPELEKFVEGKVQSGLYNNASEVVREGLRLLKGHDEIRVKWREQIERGWLQAQAGQVVDGKEVFHKADERIKQRRRKRA